MLISSWLQSFRTRLQSQPRRMKRRVEQTSREAESLEQRALLTSPFFQRALLPGGAAFPEGSTLQFTPTQVTLQFDQELNAAVANSISVVRAGGDGLFDTADDINVAIQSVARNDAPNQNEITFQFGEELQTDSYRLTIEGDDAATGVRDLEDNELLNNGADEEFFFGVNQPDPILIAVLPNDETSLNVDPLLPATTLTTPPPELVLQFNPGQQIDPLTISSESITVTRAGHDGTFGDGNEQSVSIGYVGIGDTPEEIVVRFAENLVDDTYVLTVDGDGPNPLTNIFGEVANGGRDTEVQFVLDLGARVVAVDPQPVTRATDGSLTQARDQVIVYFNDDELDPAAAINPNFYQLIFTNDSVSNEDDEVHLPTSVAYDSTTNSSVLTFASDISALSGSGAYRLRIGTDEVTPPAPVAISPGGDAGSSFRNANTSLGTLVASSTISESIDPQFYAYDFPGANDEPGHRQVEVENHLGVGADAVAGITSLQYNFQDIYGQDPQGNDLFNLITETQKVRAREIFSFYSKLLGIDFQETDDSGMTIVTGDLRALDPTVITGPGGVLGLANVGAPNGTAIMDMAEQWEDNRGGDWFETALHEIGHLLGLGHEYDLPTGAALGVGVGVEPDFPGDHDIVHGRHIHRPDSIDIDLYEFEVADAGLFTAEILAERQSQASSLDSVLRLYRQNDDGSHELIAQNDDYFSEDSYIELNLEPGTYFIGVSSTGNDEYDPTIEDTGLFGTSQGAYDLKLNFRPSVDSTIIDRTGTAFDGDGDGEAGGVYNFWFVAADSAQTVFVDKLAVSHLEGNISAAATTLSLQHVQNLEVGDIVRIDSEELQITAIDDVADTITVVRGFNGTLAAAHDDNDVVSNVASDGGLTTPFGLIDDALAAASEGSVVRIVGNGGLDEDFDTPADALPYLIGFDSSNAALEDGTSLEVPKGVSVVIDNGAVFKMRSSRVGVGSSSSTSDRSGGSLQILGTPDHQVLFTSLLDENVGTDTTNTPTTAAPGDWGGLIFRNEVDRDQNRFNYQSEGIFLNHVANADIRYGGGRVVIDSVLRTVNAIHVTQDQPTIAYNTLTLNEDSAVSADPDSFEELTFNTPRFQNGVNAFTTDYSRVGPDIYFNTITSNSTNGLFIRVETAAGNEIRQLTVPGRFDDLDIVHVIAQNLEVAGTPGDTRLEETAPDVTILNIGEAATAGTLSAGSSFRYSITFVDKEGFESPASNISDPATTTTGSISLSQLPQAVEFYTGRLIYRSTDGGAFQLVAELDKSQSSFIDDGTTQSRTLDNATAFAPRSRGRLDARLAIDPGVVVKLEGSRIQTGIGAQLIVEGRDGKEVILTSRRDDRYGAGGTFDTNDDGDLVSVLDTLLEVDFNSGTFDPAIWANVTSGATIDNNSSNPPSAPGALNLARPTAADPANVLRSQPMNLAGEQAVRLEFDFQVNGNAGSVGDLTIQYRTASATWVDLITEPAANGLPEFTNRSVALPTAALHSTFAFRFVLPGAGSGNWYVDDVVIREDRTAVEAAPGDWGGLYIGHTGSLSIDEALVTFAGGLTPLENDFASFNAIEIHQAEARIRNTTFEDNANGLGGTAPNDRFDLFSHATGTIFVRGAQPVILDNTFRDNAGPVININANALNNELKVDTGRSTGPVDRQTAYTGNQGALIRDNVLGGNEENGLRVRGEILSTQSVWDDTDIVHVLTNEVVSASVHHVGGLRLESSPDESLVVKLAGGNAGFTANGFTGDIIDRIGGIVQIVGQPGQPVILTSIHDDTVGAGFDLDGQPLNDTNNNGNATTPSGADWRGVRIEEFAHDRNVAVYTEHEVADADDPGTNATNQPEVIGSLAEDLKKGDENLRLGFEVHGVIDSPDDIDVYSFNAVAGSQIWVDVDNSTQSLDTVVELLSADGVVLAISDNSLDENNLLRPVITNNGTQAFRLDQSQYVSDDLFSLNQRDAGMRIVLPGTVGARGDYIIRVRSSNIDSLDPGANRADLEDPAKLNDGLTSGAYQLQIRMQEIDEFGGSSVQYADIRFANVGIDIVGQPIHSPLLGESEEVEGVQTDLGNVLDTDRGAIALRGEINAVNDIDFYTFEVSYTGTQLPSTAHVPITFDLDYADGFARADTSIAIYNSDNELILIGRDSNVADDQAGPLEGSDVDDLSRGSVGKFDPFIGNVELPGGVYTLAVTNNRQLPAVLDQFFSADAANPLLRLEPVNSVERIAEERFGSGTDTVTTASQPQIDLFNVNGGQLDPQHLVPFSLADVNLFVTYNNGITGTNETQVQTVNPFTGFRDTVVGEFGPSVGDIAMRPDGQLFSFTTGPQGNGQSNPGNTGNFLEINTGDASINNLGDDGQTINRDNLNAGALTPGDNNVTADPNAFFDYQAIAFVGTGDSDLLAVGTINRNTTNPPANTADVREYSTNVLWNFVSRTGAVDGVGANRINDGRAYDGAGTTQREIGQIVTNDPAATITGLTNIGGNLFAVDDDGNLYQVNAGNAATTFIAQITDDFGNPVEFASLDAGPDEVEDGAFANTLFGVSVTGELYAFDLTGVLQPIFVNGATSVALFSDHGQGDFANVTGIAFSTLDRNLWNITNNRSNDLGHGIDTRFDDSILANRQNGGNSLYFGNTRSGADAGNQNNLANGEINDVNFPGGAHGSVISNSFSLEGYDGADKPTLYFNYFLETEGAEFDYDTNPDDLMRDSFRVYVADESGNWDLITTNNGLHLSNRADEFDFGPDGFNTAAPTAQNHRDVNETFDNTDGWRQARVDLSSYAGREDLRIRFVFSTAGSLDIGNVNTAGAELYAIGADKLSDGDVFFISGERFEFDLGSELNVASGAAVLGNSFELFGETFTYDATSTGLNSIVVPASFTAAQVAALTAARINATAALQGQSLALNNIAEGDTITLDGDVFTFTATPVAATDILWVDGEPVSQTVLRSVEVVNEQLGANTVFAEGNNLRAPGVAVAATDTGTPSGFSQIAQSSGSRITIFSAAAADLVVPAAASLALQQSGGAGVLAGARSVPLPNATADRNEVAIQIRQAIANEFSSGPADSVGDIANVKGSGDLIQVIGNEVNFAGPLGFDGQLQGDEFGAAGAGYRHSAGGGGTTNTAVRGGSLKGQNNAVEGVYVDDIIIGFAERGEMAVNAAADTGFIANNDVLDPNYEFDYVGIDEGEYDLEIRRAADYAVTEPGSPTNTLLRTLDTNDREADVVSITLPRDSASYVDSAVVNITDGINTVVFQFIDVNGSTTRLPGAFEIPFDAANDTRNEMAARLRDAINSPIVQGIINVKAGLSDGTASGVSSTSSTLNLTGIVQVTTTLPGLVITEFGGNEQYGDQNRERDQGQLIIDSSFVTDSAQFGIRVDSGDRTIGGQTRPNAGAIRNLLETNDSRLATSVVITNNVIAQNQQAGIVFSGDELTNPRGIVPYGRIVNNTIVGGTGPGDNQGVGIIVSDTAAPTILNNIIADVAVGIMADANSQALLVLGSTTFRTPAGSETNGFGLGSFPQTLVATDPLFVDQENRNFYLAPLSPAIDSATDTLADRPALVAIKDPLGLGISPIIAPGLDIFGQLRGDDTSAPNTSGQGGRVFLDRGAIDRVDFAAPTATLTGPLDQSGSNPIDLDPALNSVRITGTDPVRQFVVQLSDQGIGIDDINISSDQFTLLQSGVPLVEGAQYLFRYNASTGEVTFVSPTQFPSDRNYEIRIKNTPADPNSSTDVDGVKDLAGNFLEANQVDGTTKFFITLSNGLNDAPINTVPDAQVTPEDTPLVFSDSTGNPIAVSDPDVNLGTNVLTVTLVAEHGTTALGTPVMSADGTTIRFPSASALLGGSATGQSFTIDIAGVGPQTFTFVDAALVTVPDADEIQIAADASAEDVAAAVGEFLTSEVAVVSATATGTDVALVDATGTLPVTFSTTAAVVTPSNQLTVLDGATVIGERFSVDGVFFTFVDSALVAIPEVDEIAVSTTATPDEVATAIVTVLNHVNNFGLNAASASTDTVTVTGRSVADTDGTALPVDGSSFTTPAGFAAIGEEVEIDGVVFRFVDETLGAAGTGEIAVDAADDADTVAIKTAARLNGLAVPIAATVLDNVVTVAGSAVAEVVPLTVSGATITFGDGATAIGDHISVGGVVFTFVDAADALVIANGPSATEIAVNTADDADTVTAAAAAVINAVHGAGSATAVADTITLVDVSAESEIVTVRGLVSELNVALSGLQFLPEADYFGPASLTVVTEDFGQFTFDPNGQIHLQDSDRIDINVTSVNDVPVLEQIANETVAEDQDDTNPVGIDTQEVGLTGIAAGPLNEREDVSLVPTLASTTNVAVANAARVIGLGLDVDGVTYTFVDAALVATPAANEVAVNLTDDTEAVANALADAVNANTPGSDLVAIAGDNFVFFRLDSALISGPTTEFVISDQDDLIASVTIDYTSPEQTGTLSYTPVVDAYGMVDVVVTITDAGADNDFATVGDNLTDTRTFTILVEPVNDDPTLGEIDDVTINEDPDVNMDGVNDTQSVNLSGITPRPVNELEDLAVTAELQDTTILLVSTGSDLIAETLTVTNAGSTINFEFVDLAVTAPTGNQIGVLSTDTSEVAAVKIADAVNAAFPAVPALATATSNSVAIAVIDTDLTVTDINASDAFQKFNQDDLIESFNIVYTSRDATGTFNFVPGQNAFGGPVRVVVTVTDAGIDGIAGSAANDDQTTSETFTITVLPLNDAPTIDTIADVNVDEDAGLSTVPLSGISSGADNELEDIRISATLEDSTTVAFAIGANIIGETLTVDGIVFTFVDAATNPAAGLGAQEIAVDATEATSTALTTQQVAIEAASRINAFFRLDPLVTEDVVSVFENTFSTQVPVAASSTDAFAIMSSTDIVTKPLVDYTSAETIGEITFTPVDNAFGEVVVTVVTEDAGIDGIFDDDPATTGVDESADNQSVTQQFAIRVRPVNDLPTLTEIANQSTDEGSLQQTVPLPGITAGPVNELEDWRLSHRLHDTVTIAFGNGARVIGQVINVSGVDLTYIDAATVGAGGPALDEIVVNATDSTEAVAAATALVLQGMAPSASVIAYRNTVSTDLPVVLPTPTGDALTTVFHETLAAAIVADLDIVPGATAADSPTFVYTPADADVFGVVTVSVTVEDAGVDGVFDDNPATTTIDESADNETFVRTFTITVDPVNDAPTTASIADQSTDEDAAEQSVGISGITAGPTNELEDIRLSAALADTAIVAFATGENVIGETLTIDGTAFLFVDEAIAAPVGNQIGVLTTDNTAEVATKAAAKIEEIFLNAGVASASGNSVALTLDAALVSGSDEVDAFSIRNQDDVIADIAIDYVSRETTATLRYTPGTHQFGGPVKVIVTTEDAGVDGIFEDDLSTAADESADNVLITTEFNITVAALNDVPLLSPIADQSTIEDSSEQSVDLTGIFAGPVRNASELTNELEDLQLSFELLNTTTVVVPVGARAIGETISLDGTVFTFVDAATTATPADTEIPVNATDTTEDVAAMAAQVINALPGALSVTVSENTLTTASVVAVSSANQFELRNSSELVEGIRLGDYESRENTAQLFYTPVANAYGQVTVAVTVLDAGVDGVFGTGDELTTTEMFTITITRDNDVPLFDAVPVQERLEDSGSNTITVTGIEAGPSNELEDLAAEVVLTPSTSLAIAAGANVIGETVTVGGTVFTYVDAATVGTTSGTDILVNATDSTQAIATATALQVNAELGRNALSSFENTVTTTESLSASSTVNFAILSSNQIIQNLTVNYDSPGATADVSFVTVPNAFGTVTITLSVTDAGPDGIFATGDEATSTQDIVVNLRPVNDVPTLSVVDDQTVEASGQQSVDLTGIAAGPTNELEDLGLTVTLEDTTTIVISADVINETITLDGLVFTFVDADTVPSPTDVQIPVTAGMTTLELAEAAEARINSRLGVGTVIASRNSISTSLAVAVSSTTQFELIDSADLLTDLNIVYTSRDATGQLLYTPIGTAFGVATVTVTATDFGVDGLADTADDNQSSSRTFTIEVLPVNNNPTIDDIDDQVTLEDSVEQSIALTGITTGALGELEDIRISASIDDSTVLVIPAGTDVIGKTITVGSEVFTYVETATGTGNEIVVPAVAGSVTGDTTFNVAVATADALNAMFGAGSAVATNNTVSITETVTAVDAQLIAIPASEIISAPIVTYTTGNDSGSIQYTPLANAFGQVTVSVLVEDAGIDGIFDTSDDGSTVTQVTINVTPVNDVPTLNSLSKLFLPVSAGTQTVDLSGITRGPLNEVETLRVTVTSSDPSVIPTPTVAYVSPDALGSISFTPVAGVAGASTITVTVEDAGVDGVFENADTAATEESDNLRVVRSFRVSTAPIILSPTGVITDNTPLITWTEIPSTSAYEVILTNITDGTVVTLPADTVAVNQLQITEALVLGTYEVQVRALDAVGTPGLFSVPANFTVAVAPSLITPEDVRVPDSTPTFQWTEVDGADSYTFRLFDKASDTPDVAILEVTGLTSPTYTVPAEMALALGHYCYEISAINEAADENGTDVVATLTDELFVSTPPEILIPAVAIYDTTPTITWTTLAGSQGTDASGAAIDNYRYTLRIFQGNTNNLVFSQSGIDSTSFTVPEALAVGEYQATIQAFNPAVQVPDTTSSDPNATTAFGSDISTRHIFLVGTAPVILGLSEGLGSAPIRSTTSPRPTVTWDGALDGETYEVWFSSLTEGRRIFLETGVEEQSWTVPEALPVGRYRVWVRATAGTGEQSQYSRNFDLTVVTPPVIDSFGQSTFDNQPTITWPAQQGVDSYQVWVNSVGSNGATRIYLENTDTNSFQFPDAVADGRYRVWVRGFATNEASGQTTTTVWSQAYQFDIGGRTQLILPTDKTDRTPTVSWTPVQGAVSYDLYLATADDIGNPIVRETALGATSYTFEQLELGNYRVWVRAKGPDGQFTPWSLASESFLNIQTVNDVPLTTPVLSGVVVSNQIPNVVWAAVDQAVRYDVFIASSSNNGQAVQRDDSVTGTRYVGQALVAGEYRVWVRAISGSGQISSWSVPITFNVTANDVDGFDFDPETLLASVRNSGTLEVLPEALPLAVDQTTTEFVTDVSSTELGITVDGSGIADVSAAQSAGSAAVVAAVVNESVAEGDQLMAEWDAEIWAAETAPEIAKVAVEESVDEEAAESAGWLAAMAAVPFFGKRRNRKQK